MQNYFPNQHTLEIVIIVSHLCIGSVCDCTPQTRQSEHLHQFASDVVCSSSLLACLSLRSFLYPHRQCVSVQKFADTRSQIYCGFCTRFSDIDVMHSLLNTCFLHQRNEIMVDLSTEGDAFCMQFWLSGRHC